MRALVYLIPNEPRPPPPCLFRSFLPASVSKRPNTMKNAQEYFNRGGVGQGAENPTYGKVLFGAVSEGLGIYCFCWMQRGETCPRGRMLLLATVTSACV